MRDTTKIVTLNRSAPVVSKSQVQIYSPAGEALLLFSVWINLSCFAFSDTHKSLQWDQGKIIRFGWTLDERLVLLNEEGSYRIYDLQGEYQQYSLGSEAAELGIIDARIHDSGFVALTSTLNLLEVKNWEGGRPLTLANPGE
jgi:hypothetical protein